MHNQRSFDCYKNKKAKVGLIRTDFRSKISQLNNFANYSKILFFCCLSLLHRMLQQTEE